MICTWYEVRARTARAIWGSARAQIRLVFRLVRVFCAEVFLAFVKVAKVRTEVWSVVDSGPAWEEVDSARVLVNTDKPE